MSNKIKYLLILIICISSIYTAPAQRARIPNNPNYDYKPYHFGFMLGLNQMYFIIKAPEITNPQDSLYGIESTPKMGFNIGIVADLRINDYMNLRFIPSLSFGERSLNYFIKFNNQVVSSVIKKVESTYIEFPLEIKLRSQRMINTRAYVLGGAKYCIDLASQAKKKSEEDDIVIKLYKNDILFELGVGFDFYLVYFKLCTELKMCYGIKDLLVRENNLYTNNIERLSSKMLQFSLTFE
ncbi:MAG: porin family protein [Bacteroidetes bacterium]|nr:porin family protein [Bacteroidota bacterium]